jgi:hypothetical protein
VPVKNSIRDTIFAADDLDSEIVEVPEWGVKVTLRALSGVQRSVMMDRTMPVDGGEASTPQVARWFNVMMLILCAYDPETGNALFTDEDLDALQQKNVAVIDRLGKLCAQKSGFAPDALEEATKSPPTKS